MYKTRLRKVGGSVMLAVPPAFLEALDLRAGETVGMIIEAGRLVVERQLQPQYTLEELLEQCDFSAPISREDQAWLEIRPRGEEL